MDHPSDIGLTIGTPPELTDASVLGLYNYWLALAKEARGLPNLHHFDPMRLPHLLPNIWLIEVDPGNDRFRLRLAGEQINAIYRRSIGRKYFSEVFDPRDMPRIIERYKRALQEPAVFHATGRVYASAGHYCIGERLGLPMLGSDGGTRILMGVTVYSHRINYQIALRPSDEEPRFHAIQAVNHRPVEVSGG